MEKIKLTSRDKVLYYDGKTIIETTSVKTIIKETNEVLLSNGIKIKIESNRYGEFRRTDYRRALSRKYGYIGFIRKFEEDSTDKYHTFYKSVIAKRELKHKLNDLMVMADIQLTQLVNDTETQELIIELSNKLK